MTYRCPTCAGQYTHPADAVPPIDVVCTRTRLHPNRQPRIMQPERTSP